MVGRFPMVSTHEYWAAVLLWRFESLDHEEKEKGDWPGENRSHPTPSCCLSTLGRTREVQCFPRRCHCNSEGWVPTCPCCGEERACRVVPLAGVLGTEHLFLLTALDTSTHVTFHEGFPVDICYLHWGYGRRSAREIFSPQVSFHDDLSRRARGAPLLRGGRERERFSWGLCFPLRRLRRLSCTSSGILQMIPKKKNVWMATYSKHAT